MPVSSFSKTSMVTASSSSKMQDNELICSKYVESETDTGYFAKGLLELYIGSATRYVKQHKVKKTVNKISRAEVDLNVLKSLDASDLDPLYKFSWYSAVGILVRNILLVPCCSFHQLEQVLRACRGAQSCDRYGSFTNLYDPLIFLRR